MSQERILIVDGDRNASRNLENQLKKMNFQVCGKTTVGEDALRLAVDLYPDLVCLNTRLEGKLDGFQVGEYLHTHLRLPVIFITKQADEKTLQRIREIGANGYLPPSRRTSELRMMLELVLEQQRLVKSLREKESLFRTLFKETGTMMMLVDAKTSRILDANTAACKFYGYSLEELMRKQMTDLVDQSTVPAADFQERLQQIRRYPQRRFPFRHMLANGETRSVEVYSNSIQVNGDTILHVVIQDASERARTENTLRRRDLILNAVGYAAEQFFKNPNWRSRMPEVLEQLGRTTNSSRVYLFENHEGDRGQVLSSLRYEWVAPGVTSRVHNLDFQGIDLVQRGLERWINVLSSGGFIHGSLDGLPDPEKQLLQQFKIQSILIMPILVEGYWWGYIGFDQIERQITWANADIDALRAAAGILAGAVQRQQAHEAWTQAEKKYRAIFENAVEGVFQSSPDGKFITANPALARMLGYDSPEELMEKVEDIRTQCYVDPNLGDELVELINTQNYVKNHFLQLRRKDGSVIWATEHARAVRAEDGRLLYYEGFIQDITERKRAEDTAQTTYQRYLDLVNSIDGIVWEADIRKEQYTFVSQQAERILGYPLESWFDMGFWERHIFPEDRARSVTTFGEKVREFRPFTLEYRMLTASGRLIWVRDIVTVLMKDGQPHRLTGLAVDVTEIYHHQHRQAVLVSVANALRAVDSSAEMRAVALETLHKELPLDGAALALPDPVSGVLEVVHGVGCFASRMGRRLDENLEAVHQAFHDSLPYRHPVVHVEPDLVGWVEESDPDALAVIPLTAEESPIGVLMAARREPFSSEDARMLISYGGLLSNAIQRALSNERTERSLRRLNALHKIDQAIKYTTDLKWSFSNLLPHAIAELKADAMDVFLYNPHTQLLEYVEGQGFRTPMSGYGSLRLGQSMAGQAVMERRLVHIENLHQQRDNLDRPTLLAAEAMVTYYGVPLVSKGEVRGVLEVFYRSSFSADAEMLEFLDILAGQMALAIDNATLIGDLKRSELELIVAYDSTLEGWAKALDMRDKETQGHSRRVTDMTMKLAQALHIPETELRHIHRGALLHDIGKMGVPDAILLKDGPLTDEEREKMKAHTLYAYKMLSSISFLRPALEIPYGHHEKWDGSGYPRGVQGEEIPLGARIFAVVDVWDALLSDRPYREGWPESKVLAYLQSEVGKHFDPEVVRAFLKLRAEEEGVLPEP